MEAESTSVTSADFYQTTQATTQKTDISIIVIISSEGN
jgi:hypothetical protein